MQVVLSTFVHSSSTQHMQPIGTSCSSFFVNNMMRNIIVADNLVKIIIKTSFAYFLAHQNGMHGVAAGACNRAADGVFINEWQLEVNFSQLHEEVHKSKNWSTSFGASEKTWSWPPAPSFS